jgi:adenine deaminase
MMNYPAVLVRDPLVMDKIKLAQEFHLPIDGHAPGLKGENAARYASAGITTDHECFTLEEALDKIKAGMKIIIREGSAAKNYNALHSLLKTHPENVMFCSDDKHPDDLLRGHINQLVTRSIELGYDLFSVLRAACLHPIEHYNLKTGCLQANDPADMIMVNNLQEFKVQSTWIDGMKVFDGKEANLPSVEIPVINQFQINPIHKDDLTLQMKSGPAKIIVAIDGAIVTDAIEMFITGGEFESDPSQDILKMVVVNRYNAAPVAKH